MQARDPYMPVPPRLASADRLARATDLWIRRGVVSGALGPVLSVPGARRELAAGMVAGLCESFALDNDTHVLALYICALLDDDRDWAARLARPRTARATGSEISSWFRAGRAAADALVGALQGMAIRR